MMRADIISVFHNQTNYAQHRDLFEQIRRVEPEGGYRLIGVDNRRKNRGFSAACNLAARHRDATAPILGFLNPDAEVHGPFLDRVEATLQGGVVITGCRFGKADRELRAWGIFDWVCGAAMFVSRDFFTRVGGFDEQFVWAWEESDLIRQAQRDGFRCQSIELPIAHASPDDNPTTDVEYKRFHFDRGAQRYAAKWKNVRVGSL